LLSSLFDRLLVTVTLVIVVFVVFIHLCKNNCS